MPRTAGSPDSSATSRVQSAGTGAQPQPWSMNATSVPGSTDSAHGPATPAVPWQTKSMSSSSSSGRNARTV